MRKLWTPLSAVLVLLATSFFIVQLPVPAAPAAKETKAAVLTPVELRAWYDAYNRDYFGNHLTNFVEFEWKDMHGILRMGQTNCLMGHCIITMDPTYNEAFPVAKATILHEMCHVKTEYEIEDHGPKWGACMDTLWVEGAFKGLI